MLLGLSFQEHLVKPLNFKVLLFFICKKEEKDKKKKDLQFAQDKNFEVFFANSFLVTEDSMAKQRFS